MAKTEIDYETIWSVTKATYNSIAEFFVPLLSNENASQKEIQAMERFINRLPTDARIADLGCGAGKHGRYCAQKNAERGTSFSVFGLDISEKMIERAKSFNGKDGYAPIEFLSIADMCDFSTENVFYDAAKFDAVIMAYSLIHLDKLHAKDTLSNLKKIINNNAWLFITVYRGTRNNFQREELKPTHDMFYRDYFEEEFKSLVSEAGYEIVEFTQWKDTDPISGGAVSFDTGVLCITAQYRK